MSTTLAGAPQGPRIGPKVSLCSKFSLRPSVLPLSGDPCRIRPSGGGLMPIRGGPDGASSVQRLDINSKKKCRNGVSHFFDPHSSKVRIQLKNKVFYRCVPGYLFFGAFRDTGMLYGQSPRLYGQSPWGTEPAPRNQHQGLKLLRFRSSEKKNMSK